MEPDTVIVNGLPRPLATDPHTTALDWLRDQGLTGAKEGCAEGECGACSVLVARPGLDTPTEWTALNACLLPAAALDGQEVVTAEGLGSPDALHPVQHEMAVRGGSQCGYCTPGFVCSMAAEYYRADRVPLDGRADHEHGPNGFDLHALSGNLCRCTGYRPIRDAAFALGHPDLDDSFAARRHEPPPPPRPSTRDGFVRPADLAQALRVLADEPEALVVAGCTDTGVEANLRGARPGLVVAVDRLDELRELRTTPDHLHIGAALSLTEIERRIAGTVPLLDQTFPQFASRPIRNAATIGGNLATASPIGDLAPALLALDATVVLTSLDGDREVAAGRLLHRLPADRPAPRRADPGGAGPAAGRPGGGLPQDRQAPLRRHLQRRGRVRARHRRRRRTTGRDRSRRRRRHARSEPPRPRPRWSGSRGPRRRCARPPPCWPARARRMDDHRASAAYRTAMLGQALLRLHAEQQEVSA